MKNWVDWKIWATPDKLWEGQKVRVWRWQVREGTDPPDAKGHWEEGIVTEVLVDLNSDTNSPLRVAAVDLSRWWGSAGHSKHRKTGRPPVGIVMRSNMYWLKMYRVESLDPMQELEWPPVPQPPAKSSRVFQIGV